MKQMTRYAIILIVIVSLVISNIPLSAYAVTDTHPNTHINTGDQRSDIIAVALTQVGYLEGPNNDNKYGVWYGYNNIAWCGIYVAWCANQAGVPTSVLAKTGIANPASYGLTAEPAGYIPKPGDLFFTFDHSHVGFVYYVEGAYFYSLEGNTWENGPEGVYIRKHRLDSKKYASPNYQGGGDHNYVLSTEADHPHKEFYRCKICGDKYYTGKDSVSEDCITCIQNNCAHSFSAYLSESEHNHSRKCSICGKEEYSAHNWTAENVIEQATCSIAGSKEQVCSECGETRVIIIAATGVHSYTQWQYSNDEIHSRKCINCGKEEVSKHNKGTEREMDEGSHWYNCSVCNERIDFENHKFGESCDSPCEICQFIRADGHSYSFELSYDGIHHWRSCEFCGVIAEEGEHVFTSECDELCDTCGYSRTTQHTASKEYQFDGDSHWFSCESCDAELNKQAHTPQTGLRQGAIVCCTVCNCVLTSEAMHTHGYDEVYKDELWHWGTCSCGIDLEKVHHQWSVKTELCSICSQPMPERHVEDNGFIPWLAGGTGFLSVGSLLIVLLLKKRF